MEDAPTGQRLRQDGSAGPTGTESAGPDVGGADPDVSGADPDVSGPEPDVGGVEGDWRGSGRQTGGRRYRAGRPPPRRRPTTEQPRVQATPLPAGFGAWGMLGGLFACCLASCLLAAWLHLIVVAGLGFCVGCALAAWYCLPAALLRMVIAVPTVFLLAEILTQFATLQHGGRHGLALPVAGGTLLTLAALAPWLFAGTAGAIAIAMFRGLPRCVSDLRAELRGRTPAGRAPGPRPPRARRGPPAEQALRAQQALRALNAQRAQQAQRARQAQPAPRAQRAPRA